MSPAEQPAPSVAGAHRASPPVLETDEICRHLRSSSFFASVSEDVILDLAGIVELVAASAGERLIEKGEIGSAMFFVVHGSVRVHVGDVVLSHLGPGEAFGEIGALASQARTASVTAEIDSFLLKLDQSALYGTMSRQPEAALSVIRALCHRQTNIIHDTTTRSLKLQLLEHEMAIAKDIQQSFLPEVLPEVAGWRLAGFLKPAREIAGDFYDFFTIPTSGCVGVVIGDVCDKGVGAALFMTLFRSLIRATSMHRDFAGTGRPSTDVTSTLRYSIALTNQYIATTHRHSNMFSSVFFGLLIPETGKLCYINAGHEAPLVVAGGEVRRTLEPTGPVIGLFADAEHDVEVVELLPGETLVAYTDGVTDAKNRAGEHFSDERLLSTIRTCSPGAGSTLHEIVSAVEGFIGDASQYDDLTIIAVHREQKKD